MFFFPLIIFAAFTVRLLTKRFIGEYDSSLGKQNWTLKSLPTRGILSAVSGLSLLRCFAFIGNNIGGKNPHLWSTIIHMRFENAALFFPAIFLSKSASDYDWFISIFELTATGYCSSSSCQLKKSSYSVAFWICSLCSSQLFTVLSVSFFIFFFS